MKRTFMVFFALVALLSSAFALEIGGVALPDQVNVGEGSVPLNGAGLRKKLFIKVYAGGLYAPEKSKDAAALIAADAPGAVRMHFIYKLVEKEKLTGGWDEGFAKTANGQFASEISAFNALFDQDAKKDDVYEIHYLPGVGITVFYNGTEKGKVSCDVAFKKAVWAIWLGESPADEGLKEGMLGL